MKQSRQPKDLPVMSVAPTNKSFHRTYFVMIGALMVTLASVGLLLFWAFQPTNILEIKNAPFPVRTIRKHPTADGVVILKVDYCKHKNVEGVVRTSFVAQSREIFLPETIDKQDAKCEVVEVPVLIPHDTPADTYKVKFRTRYKLNPLKDNVVNEFESQTFKVEDGNVSR